MVNVICGIVALALAGMFVDLRMKTWALPLIFVILWILPQLLYSRFKGKSFRPAVISLLVVFGGGILAAVIGEAQNRWAKSYIERARGEAASFLIKQGRAPTLDEFARLMGSTPEDIRSPFLGVNFRYRSNITPIACLRIYQFPSSWLQTCLDSPEYEVLPDRD